MIRLRLVFLAVALVGASCAGGPGDLCQRDSDCRAGLRCAAASTEGGRGICTYPAPATRDARPSDGRADTRPAEAQLPEARIVDSATSDSSRFDLPTRDRPPDLPGAAQ
jgi:hypothetical protein